MNILLTTHQLADFGGSENFIFELAKALHDIGHQVKVYSRYVDKFQKVFDEEGIYLTTNLNDLKDVHFDVAHVQHNINALEVRQMFPDLPIFFMVHGIKPFLETPPALDINITYYGAVSQRVRSLNLAQHGISNNKIVIVNGIIDDYLFKQTEEETKIYPKKALIISHRMTKANEDFIRAQCMYNHMSCVRVGRPGKVVSNQELPKYINDSDIVITLGRGALEAMMCGIAPIILDETGCDGLVTPLNYNDLESCHFNGMFLKQTFNSFSLKKELTGWSPVLGDVLRRITFRKYSRGVVIEKLMKTYEKTITDYKPKKINTKLLDFTVEAIHTTRLFTFSNSEPYLIAPKSLLRKVARKVYNKLP